MNQDARKDAGYFAHAPITIWFYLLLLLISHFLSLHSQYSYPQHLVYKKRWNYTDTLGFQLPFDHTNLCTDFLSTLFLVLSLCFLLALHYAPISPSLRLIFSLFFLDDSLIDFQAFMERRFLLFSWHYLFLCYCLSFNFPHIERYRSGEDNPHLKVLQAAHISDDEYFSHMVLDDLNLIIRDIREAHKKDSESAPQTTVVDKLKENLEAVENFKVTNLNFFNINNIIFSLL